MNEFIKAIFTTSPYGRDFIRFDNNKEYARLNKKEDELYKKLEASLSPELFKILDEFINTLLDRQAIVSEQYYIAGFKTATRLATESNNLSDIFDT